MFLESPPNMFLFLNQIDCTASVTILLIFSLIHSSSKFTYPPLLLLNLANTLLVPPCVSETFSDAISVNAPILTQLSRYKEFGVGDSAPQCGIWLSCQDVMLQHHSSLFHNAPCRDELAYKKIVRAKLAKDFQFVLKEFQKEQFIAAERETT
ncbi:unnamed protein product [Sphenostylis stenocarpa]|uniref:Uncharacterized protein n=1 Tax=Sphenostylis stenocarpa TaxID=92480 RepID=A0AA86SSS2_9FABA|nr:unnamed protein product [Sphenostylis stenocarpa]